MAQKAVTGRAADPMPARISAWAIYDVFETADDSHVFIGVVTDALWQKFCEMFCLDELWADLSLRKNNERVLARDRLMPQIRALVKGFTRDEIIARLDGTGLPFAPIGRPEDMFDDLHLLASGGLEAVTLDDGRTTTLPGLPIEMDGARVGGDDTLPLPGADTRKILSGLGYTISDVEVLLKTGVVA